MAIDKEQVKNIVAKALDYQFETYTFTKMLEDCPLTPEELAWAKEHLGYKLEEY